MTRPRRESRALPVRARERFVLPALAIFAVALSIRLIHVWQIRKAPFFTVLMGDSRAYDAWAQQLAQGDWLGREVFYQAPLYPYLLGVLYAMAGRDLAVVRIAQAILGSLACVLLALSGWRLFSKSVGIVAGLALAFYAPAIFFDALVQKSVLDVFFICLAIWLLMPLVGSAGDTTRVQSREARLPWLWLGLALGGLSLTRENSLVLIAVIVVWALARQGTRNEKVADAGVFLLGLAIVLLPVAIRNTVVGGEFHVTTSQFGPNFYIGNNPRADGTYMALRFGRAVPEHERQDATELAESAMGRRLSAAEVSSYWTRQALDFIESHPAAWLTLLGTKLMLVWNATEMVDTESQATHEEWSAPLRVAGRIGHFGVLVPLALLGVVATWPDRSRLWVFYALIVSYAGSVVMFYVLARYRYPLVPFLLLFASAGLVALPRMVRANPFAHTAVTLAAVAAVGAITNWPTVSTGQMQAVTEANLGVALHAAGRLDEAADHYRRAIALRSDYAVAHDNLGILLGARGRLDEAASEFRMALQLDPDSANTHRHLGEALASRGAHQEALEHLNRAVQLAPDDGPAHYALASELFEGQDFAGAVDHFRATIRLMPDDVDAYNDLGITLASQDQFEAAIEQFQLALQLKPGFADAQRNLATAIEAARARQHRPPPAR